MKNFQEKKSFWHVLASWPFLFILFLLLLTFSWNIFGFVNKMTDTSKNKKIAENKVEELKQNKNSLEQDIAQIETDRGIEEKIREDFGLAKEGEGMIVIVDEQKKENEETEETKKGFFSFIKNWFK